jgi:hypothetical protein
LGIEENEIMTATIFLSVLLATAPADAGGTSLFAPTAQGEAGDNSAVPSIPKMSADKKTQGTGTNPKMEHSLPPVGTSSMLRRPTRSTNAPIMPVSPTDSNASVGEMYQWLPPTAAAAAGRSQQGAVNSMPNSPTRGRPDVPQNYSSMATAQMQRNRMEAARNSARPTVQGTTKPYSDQRSMGGTISPYMNLFRTGNAGGTIDNYSTLVRPELDQRRLNSQMGNDINNLESTYNVQSMNIRQLGRQTQSLNGVNANQYYMNYGDYYSGFHQ